MSESTQLFFAVGNIEGYPALSDETFQSYMICTAPRSGSTLLCKLLAGTNISGKPGSHFHDPSLDDWIADYDLTSLDFETREDAIRAVFEAAIARGKGGTNMFGLRMQRGSFDYFMQQLEHLFPGKMSDVHRIESAFGRTLFVHLTRSDRLGQAISRVRAEQTGLWHRWADGTDLERLAPPQEARYDAEAIRYHMVELASLDDAWETWFDQEKIAPLRINYDDLSQSPQSVLAQMLSALHLDPTPAHSVETPTAKLADATNRSWRERFEREN